MINMSAFEKAWSVFKQRGFEVMPRQRAGPSLAPTMQQQLEALESGDFSQVEEARQLEERRNKTEEREIDPMTRHLLNQQAEEIEAEGIDLPDGPRVSAVRPANIGQAGSSGVLPPVATTSIPNLVVTPTGAGFSNTGQQDYQPDFDTFSQMRGFDDGQHHYPDMYEPTLNRRFNRLDVGRFPNRKTQEQMYVPESYTGEPLFPPGQEPPVNIPIAPQILAVRLNNPFDPNEVALMRQTMANEQTPLGQALAQARSQSPQPLQFEKAWSVLKSRTNRDYPFTPSGRAGKQTQYSPNFTGNTVPMVGGSVDKTPTDTSRLGGKPMTSGERRAKEKVGMRQMMRDESAPNLDEEQ